MVVLRYFYLKHLIVWTRGLLTKKMLEDDFLNTDRTFLLFSLDSCPLYLDSHGRISELFNYKRGQMLTFIYTL